MRNSVARSTRSTCHLCGPRSFPRDLAGSLLAESPPVERVRYEFFGPADELLTAETPDLIA